MAWLRCQLFPGQFSSEFAVVVRSFSGRELSLFSSKNDVQFDKEPTKDGPASGFISVEIVECEQDLCLVRLPQTTLENGNYLTVPKSDVREPMQDEVRMFV